MDGHVYANGRPAGRRSGSRSRGISASEQGYRGPAASTRDAPTFGAGPDGYSRGRNNVPQPPIAGPVPAWYGTMPARRGRDPVGNGGHLRGRDRDGQTLTGHRSIDRTTLPVGGGAYGTLPLPGRRSPDRDGTVDDANARSGGERPARKLTRNGRKGQPRDFDGQRNSLSANLDQPEQQQSTSVSPFLADYGEMTVREAMMKYDTLTKNWFPESKPGIRRRPRTIVKHPAKQILNTRSLTVGWDTPMYIGLM